MRKKVRSFVMFLIFLVFLLVVWMLSVSRCIKSTIYIELYYCMLRRGISSSGRFPNQLSCDRHNKTAHTNFLYRAMITLTPTQRQNQDRATHEDNATNACQTRRHTYPCYCARIEQIFGVLVCPGTSFFMEAFIFDSGMWEDGFFGGNAHGWVTYTTALCLS